MNRKTTLAPLAAGLAVVAAAPALGATGYATKLGISYKRASGGSFSGSVKSPAAGCLAGRKVTVYRKKSGPDPALGRGTTDARGRWQLNPRNRVRAGSYYATTPAVQRSGVTCDAGRSVVSRAS